MSLECWYYLAGIGSFVVALGGLVGLIIYAVDTRRIRKAAQDQAIAARDQAAAAQAQLEGAIAPCVLLMEDADQSRDFDKAHLILKNVGAGVALNIRWRYMKLKDSTWAGAPALAPGDFIRPPVHSRDVMDGHGIECEFSSLSGVRYRAVTSCAAEMNVSLELRHRVERIASA